MLYDRKDLADRVETFPSTTQGESDPILGSKEVLVGRATRFPNPSEGTEHAIKQGGRPR